MLLPRYQFHKPSQKAMWSMAQRQTLAKRENQLALQSIDAKGEVESDTSNLRCLAGPFPYSRMKDEADAGLAV